MPPHAPGSDGSAHSHSHDHDHDHDHGGPEASGLPVRHRLLRPGSLATGFLIAAFFAAAAQARSLGAGLVWDDRVFLLDDERVRSLASVVTAFGDLFFGVHAANEMYRPVVNASLAIDWFLSGSAPGAPRVWFFHAVNLLLHAANAGLVYVLLSNLTKRKLGAPLIAAVLWGMHPLCVEPVSWIVGRCDLLAAFFALLAAVVFVRSPGRRGAALGAAGLFALSLFAKASAAALPAILAAGLVAYHGIDAAKLATPRIRRPLLLLAAPLALWLAATWIVMGSPFPNAAGVRWKGDVPLADGFLGAGRGAFLAVSHALLPTGLSADYAGDVLSAPQKGGAALVATGLLGWGMVLGAAAYGLARLRRSAFAFPLLAFALAMVPVLQFVRIGAIHADRFVYLPLVFLALAAAEALERLYYRFGAARGLSVTLIAFAALPVLSWTRGAVWAEPVAFWRDVVRQYPDDADARIRLASSLSDAGGAGPLREAEALLAAMGEDPEALSLLGAVRLEAGDLEGAAAALEPAAERLSSAPTAGSIAFYNLAVCRKRQGRAADARAAAERALALRPGLRAAERLLDSLR